MASHDSHLDQPMPGPPPPMPPAGNSAPKPLPPRPAAPKGAQGHAQQAAPLPPRPAAPQPASPQPVAPQPASPQPARPQAAQPQPVRPQPASPQPVQPKPAQPQPLQPGQQPSARQPGGKTAPIAPIPLKKGEAALPVDREGDEEDEVYTWREWAQAYQGWLVSALFQMLMIIILGLWMLPRSAETGVEINAVFADQPGDEFEDDPFDLQSDTTFDEVVFTPSDLTPVDDPFAAPPELQVTVFGATATSQISAPTIGLALSGRDAGSKAALLAAYGGTAQSEAAVGMALEWLARQQRPDGSWSMTGPYGEAGNVENFMAATGMALLAFQGNGHTHQKGRYQKEVERGMKFLIKSQDPDGSFFEGVRSHARLYTHGQCTIAVCELYGMTGDSWLRGPAERAVEFCVKFQDRAGGWRYTPGMDSDTSVTGWILMGLQSAKMAGLEVPPETLKNVEKYLDSAATTDGGGVHYAYIPGAAASEVMTAEGLLCRQYLGWPQDDERLIRGAEFLTAKFNLPTWTNRNVYYWYYATQMLHHMEGDYWKTWNNEMRDLLVKNQQRSGREKGSWHPLSPTPDRWGGFGDGGRLYVTCLSVYILEVYYRHLPIYSHAASGGF